MTEKKKYRIFGDRIDPAAIEQMEDAAGLKIAVKGALMPDAHKGYGLPIGGVLATRDAVIPYAVGVDIACRMKMSILPMDPGKYERYEQRFQKALETQTRFGVGGGFKKPLSHRVMDEDWGFSKTVRDLRDLAWKQLGTSGSGNHFAEFGSLRLEEAIPGLAPGNYIAFLTHSGSRGAGAKIADHYSKLAAAKHPELDKRLRHLAWLDTKSQEGIEYFKAMELMGRYASANHELIHERVLKEAGQTPAATIENHHNFAFREKIGLRNVIVHRKGATPAGKGILGIIPGSMCDPGFVVRGLGSEDSIDSAAHGAGRAMSRTAAKKKYTKKEMDALVKKHHVRLLNAGLDEIPLAYKDIRTVMDHQKNFVQIIARFDPRLVMMAGPGKRGGPEQKRRPRKKKR